MPVQRPIGHRPHLSRHGGAVLELIVCMPALLIVLFAIVEFGLFMGNQQQLEYASRMGAKVASELTAVSAVTFSSDVAPAVKRHLEQAGMDPSDPNILITLKHNVGGDPLVLTAGALVCPAPDEPPPPANGTEYVRVTVCLDIIDGKMTPNLLKTLGVDVQGRVTQQTTTLRYECE